jgi:hypothetical protein
MGLADSRSSAWVSDAFSIDQPVTHFTGDCLLLSIKNWINVELLIY